MFLVIKEISINNNTFEQVVVIVVVDDVMTLLEQSLIQMPNGYSQAHPL
ncbi:hypothetical protein [Clostridium uliginosum]|nr:hypothetical protein [Clostridium uliginosum]